MIEINLLPEDRRPAKGTPLPRLLVILGGVIGFCLEIVVLGMFALRFRGKQGDLQGLKFEREGIRKLAEQVDVLQAEISWINERGGSAKMLLKDRREWAPILYRLSDPEILPPAIWFRKVSIKQPGRGAGRKAVAAKACLVLEGYAQGPDTGTMLYEITAFQANLQRLVEDFADDFDGEPKAEDRAVATLSTGRDISEHAPKEAYTFTIRIPLKTVGAGAAKKKEKK